MICVFGVFLSFNICVFHLFLFTDKEISVLRHHPLVAVAYVATQGVVCTLHEGDDFGKLALVNDAPRSLSVHCQRFSLRS